ncbi:hypothetical protein BD324DRAFT_633933 [Kockovaella imperatae]|uniref:Uncharacterized protein n=1 Tax=Kockovaella imperatae TaxID=4999 RepID=A0A1Y1UC96_9TREE|nr:hypothetical protein BD324DRAFT_633933 [Kockovaella imperatae]ORX35116.1 hypothetical protein BD324DRAFT_633933 [Kockovaella imperatae]
MDADPWADAPATPKMDGRTPVPSPQKQTDSTSATHSTPGPSSPIAESEDVDSTHVDPDEPATQMVDSPIEDIPAAPIVAAGQPAEEDADFDDFVDFDEPAAGPSSFGASAMTDGDDGFGDFGDFEGGDESVETFGDQSGTVGVQPMQEPRDWAALHLDPFPSRSALRDQIASLLSPLMAESSGSSSRLTDEPPREVAGLGQIMVSESSREAYAQLTTAPILRSLDWTRSRVRREHLISMGVPVNLDEVDSHRLSSLPPLRISTTLPSSSSSRANHPSSSSRSGKGEMLPPAVPRPASVDGRRSTRSPAGESYSNQRSSTGDRGNGISPNHTGPKNASQRNRRDQNGMGPKPVLDTSQAEELCGLDEDALSLYSLERLRTIQNELVETSAQASALLAWYLQLKDAQTQDAETYNGMISELIANAAKAKQAQTSGSGGVFRRSSLKTRPQSSSGSATPGRIGSPAIR